MRKKVEIDMRRAGEFGLSMTPAFWITAETIIGPPSTGYLSDLHLFFGSNGYSMPWKNCMTNLCEGNYKQSLTLIFGFAILILRLVHK